MRIEFSANRPADRNQDPVDIMNDRMCVRWDRFFAEAEHARPARTDTDADWQKLAFRAGAIKVCARVLSGC